MSKGLGADKREDGAEFQRVEEKSPEKRSGAVPPLFDAILDLQRLAGNEAVTQLLGQPSNAVPVQRFDPDASPSANPAAPEEKKTGIERIKEIHTNRWVGPFDEWELEELWGQLGPEGAKNHPKEFAESIEYGMDPDNLPGAGEAVDMFQSTVKNMAIFYLDGNLADLGKEEKSVGIGEDKPAPEHDATVQEIVGLAQKAQTLDEMVKAYGKIVVGYNVELVPNPYPVGEGPSSVLDYVPATFTPGKPPEKPLSGSEGTGARPYEEVLANYSKTNGALLALADQHPSIYLALKTGSLESIAGKDGQAASDPRGAMKTVLASARQAINETKTNVSTGGIDWHELKPLHAQLFRGDKNVQGPIDWTSPWYKAILKDEVGDWENIQTLIDVGIGLAAATAFIFSELATGGMATVLWAGAGLTMGGMNVARKWANYDELKSAAAAGTSTATELVGKDQVDAALLDAIIESAFFFLDAVGVGVKAAKGAAALGIKKAGAAAAQEAMGSAALKGLKSLSGEEAAKVASKGIDQLGVKGAADAAGMSVDDMLKLVGEQSAAGGKIKAFQALAKEGVEPAKLAEALKTALTGKEVIGQNGAKLTADRIVMQAIDEFGFQRTLQEAGGWKKLAAGIGPTSEAGQRLKAWRDSIYADLKKYVESLRTPEDGAEDLIKETGTLENVTNDLDISFLGKHATERKDKAAQFLAGRTGLSADSKALDNMLYIGLFTDPRRMHLFDEFPELQAKLAKRTMKFEEELIWNDEYHKYLVKAGKGDQGAKQMAEKIGAEMDALGVSKLPNFKPLSDRAVDVLSREQDRLHTAIEAAAKGGDLGQAEKLIEELSTIQAQINVKEGGGYFSAGGVRRFVTEKEGFPGARAATTAAHDLGAALDQVNKLRKAVSAFEAEALKAPATRDAAALAAHIKDLAKYGDRFTSVADVLGKKVPGGESFHNFAEEFSDLLLQARGKTVHTTQELLARRMESVIAKTQDAIAQFDALHVDILRALRERAAIEGIGDLAPDILRATQVRYRLLMFQSALIMQMGTAARAAGIPVQDAVRDTEGESGGTPGAEESGTKPPVGDFPVPSGGSQAA